ncbi:helix-turn-helix transcriptional regulator [Ruania suaedae]|uniref:helix-turn-helix domain-containing protein n=1 Tax=Ruania suaedae TaxID=2897774 RepID=UPI001E4F35A7|nr:helix-turn-helix transcriptional regulator [Ruania suaedae]UFU03474.1 helix-turn-helix transcriptional regulator [Ruania suaedae]
MKLRDAGLLAKYMEANDFTQARLGRYAGCSRQFIHMLVNGEKSTCTRPVGERIEEALRVLPGTLFVPNESPTARPQVKRRATVAA